MSFRTPSELKILARPVRQGVNDAGQYTASQVPTLNELTQIPPAAQPPQAAPANTQDTPSKSSQPDEFKLSPGYSPDEEAVKDKFKNMNMNWKGLQIGLLAGSVTGLLAGGISWFSKDANSLTQLALKLYGFDFKLSKPATALFTAFEALSIGGAVGFTVGGDINHRVQTKLEQISALEKGEKPKRPWQDNLNPFAPKPPTTKQQAIDDLNDNELDKRKAFTTGAIHGLVDKGLALALGLGIAYGIKYLAAKGGDNALYTKDQADTIMKLSTHKTVFIKALAVPIMGGIIAIKALPLVKDKVKAVDKANTASMNDA